MSDEKPKTADDIVSELREKYASYYYCEESTRRDGEYPEGFDVIDTRKLADSIEEAVKRERASFDCECADIAFLAAEDAMKRYAPGLREALELCMKKMCEYCHAEAAARGGCNQCLFGCETLNKAKAALAGKEGGKGDGV